MATIDLTITKKNYVKRLKEIREQLTLDLTRMTPGTEEFEATVNGIKSIDDILHERTNTRWKVINIAGLLILGIVGLGFAHIDDIGDTIPGKYVSKFVESIVRRV